MVRVCGPVSPTALVAAAAFMWLMTGCTYPGNGVEGEVGGRGADQGTVSPDGTSRLVLSGTKPGVRLDPHLDAQWEVLYILSAVYDTLVEQSEDGELIPGLARQWHVDEDGRQYVFELRDDVRFHDGTRFDAEAVKFNIDRILSLGPRSLKSGTVLPDFDSIDVIDDFTIRFELSRPDSYFLYWLSMPYLAMVSPAAARMWGDRYHHHQSGTGPFRFVEYLVGDRYTLRRNPQYVGALPVEAEPGAAMLEEIVWRFLPEPSTRSLALEAGDIDIAFDLLPTDAEQLAGSTDYTVSQAPLSGQPAFWFLNTSLSPTDDIRVRQAILFAADMDAAVRAITRGFNPVAHGPLSAVTPEYEPQLERLYAYDPERAGLLLGDAGWLDEDGDGIRERDGAELTIAMSMVSWGKSPFFSEMLYSQLQDVGIRLQLEMVDYSVQMDLGREGSRNMLFMGGSGHSASDSLRGYFHSRNANTGFAWSKYRDPALDALLDDAIATQNPERRAELYSRAQLRIMDQALILPIYDYVLLVGMNARVRGLRWDSTGLIPNFHEIRIAAPAVSP